MKAQFQRGGDKVPSDSLLSKVEGLKTNGQRRKRALFVGKEALETFGGVKTCVREKMDSDLGRGLRRPPVYYILASAAEER